MLSMLYACPAEYYGVKSSEVPAYTMQRTRQQVEDRELLQLAGIESYTAAEAKMPSFSAWHAAEPARKHCRLNMKTFSH